MPNLYDVGDMPKVTGTFVNTAGSPVDPGSLIATWKGPDGVETTYTYPTSPELVRENTGVYSFYITVTQFGRYFYRFFGSGANQAAEESHFDVRKPVL